MNSCSGMPFLNTFFPQIFDTGKHFLFIDFAHLDKKIPLTHAIMTKGLGRR